MNIGQFCNRRVEVCTAAESIRAAAQRMREHHTGCLVVVTERDGMRVPVGILTDRDIVVGPLAQGVNDFDAITVGDVMSPRLVVARHEESLEEGVERMRAFGVRRIPVVGHRGALEGLISFDDIIELLAADLGGLARLVKREAEREAEFRP